MTAKRIRYPLSAFLQSALKRFDEISHPDFCWPGAATSRVRADTNDRSRRAVVAVLRASALSLVPSAARDKVRSFRLFQDDFCATRDLPEVAPLELTGTEGLRSPDQVDTSFEELGQLLEALLSYEQLRKQRGRFYTPRAVVDDVVSRALLPWSTPDEPFPRVVDPACGGGAFLFGVARALQQRHRERESPGLRRAIFDCLHGSDIEPLAVAVTEIALALWAGVLEKEAAMSSRFLQQDSLDAPASGSFELVIGNPPWVAYAGRATQPLNAARRRWLSEQYHAFRGYPTLQACFIELGARLAPKGRVALLVPSPVADLDGYRPMRRVLSKTHRVVDELVEYGQDAFDGVVQPCFALIADATASVQESDAPFHLVERSDHGETAARVEPPSVLLRLREQLPTFPSETFRELGFQTTTVVTKNLLLRNATAEPPFDLPLLEGRDVSAFRVGRPRLFLNPERDSLRRANCRLRPKEDYEAVEFVVRQTAKYTIAALHSGVAFRNSLIAGFGTHTYGAEVMVGLLNSVLLRALHLAAQRDARQKTFPQVKLAHLRGLPAPPTSSAKAAKLGQLVRSLSEAAVGREERARLDALVFDWYGVSADEATAVERFYVERGGSVS